MLDALRRFWERLQGRPDESRTLDQRLDATSAAVMHHDAPELGGSGLPPPGYLPSGQDEGRPRH